MCSNTNDIPTITKWHFISIALLSQGRTGRLGFGHWWCWCGWSPSLLSPDPSWPFTPKYTSHHAGDPIFYDPQASVIYCLSRPGFYSAENAE